MFWFLDIQMMETFQATEEASPSPDKLAAHLHPYSFNTRVPGGPDVIFSSAIIVKGKEYERAPHKT